MIDYRSFRNTDPPGLCEIWCSQAPLRACYQPLTPAVLEKTVLSRPFFDPDGLIVAVEHGKPIGFAHAGFGFTADGSRLDTSVGATCMLLVSDLGRQRPVAQELLMRSEQYLRQRGARLLYGGGRQGVAPFYLGLYGGASHPGVLETDLATLELFRDAGYVETGRTSILQRQLASFRPVVNRQLIQFKRRMQVECLPDPAFESWREACTHGLADRFLFSATERGDESSSATVLVWDMEPLASSWGVHARGLVRLQVNSPRERETVALFLLGEALRQMAAEGATLAEAHIDAHDDPLGPILGKLGFEHVEQAIELSNTTS